MASSSSPTKVLLLKRLWRALKAPSPAYRPCPYAASTSTFLPESSNCAPSPSRNFCSRPSNPGNDDHSQGPAPIDYRSLLQEDEFHRLADSTIHDLLEKIDEYADSIDIDGFDIDYGNEVLTLKLGALGTFVVNKQTPNRQIWMSSPVSGPSRFDWDLDAQTWIYRRNKANLLKVLESELEQLCGKPISLL
ncbi:hypothetical protein RJ640_011220 [Escallonia rubra]|uniref:ferroxidase n=1 Tax=Escallonia rubra TaxID=112253 RepID=A0AA88RKH1_9ASTE|nr:hypothetical protein RJ640_011220 [Escallonia rubra]